MFKTMQGCLSNTKIKVEDSKKISNFIFQRYISGDPVGLEIVAYSNLFDLSSYAMYELYRTYLKDKKIKYIKYYKDDKKSEDIEFLMKHYQCSREVAESYLELLDEEKLKILKDSYGGR